MPPDPDDLAKDAVIARLFGGWRPDLADSSWTLERDDGRTVQEDMTDRERAIVFSAAVRRFIDAMPEMMGAFREAFADCGRRITAAFAPRGGDDAA
jgi:hypothetical protein